MRLVYVRTDKDSHFTGSLAQNAAEAEDVVLPSALRGPAGSARFRIRSVVLQSDQNLAWDLYFYSKDTKRNADLDLDSFAGRVVFAAADGAQIAATGQFYYFKESIDIGYQDDDGTGELHVELVNRSASSKNAGATGEVVVLLACESAQFD